VPALLINYPAYFFIISDLFSASGLEHRYKIGIALSKLVKALDPVSG
jgi:hypothetical protein